MKAMQTFRNFLFIFIAGTQILAQSPFEGKVVLRITGDETADIDYYVKDENIRMEMDADGNEAALLYNTKTKKTIMMMPAQNMYMEFDGNDFKMPDSKMNDKKDDMGDINRTGEFKEINGYKCEKWIFTDEDDNTVEAWMTDELGNFFMFMNPMDKGAQDAWKQKLQGDYFPMKVEVMEDGEKTSSMEVVSVNKMSLKDELFKVKPGMQKFDMPNMNMYKQN